MSIIYPRLRVQKKKRGACLRGGGFWATTIIGAVPFPIPLLRSIPSSSPNELMRKINNE
jgi:hypothetical protein